MADCLTKGEPVDADIRRIMLELVDEAVAALRGGEGSAHKGIHKARKDCKRLRAVLRLVRTDIGGQRFRAENVFVRDAQRLISAVRDTAAIIETLDDLAAHYERELEPQAFAELRRVLVERCREIEARQIVHADTPAQVAGLLEDRRERFAALPLRHGDFRVLRGGLKRIYRDGRRALAGLDRDSSPHALHEWRKQVKYLWSALRVVEPAWPGPLKSLGKELKCLADRLGTHHDLTVLRDIAAAEDFGATAASALVALIDRRRRELEEEVRPLGRRIYADRPRVFIGRMEAWWDAWQAAPHAEAA